MTVCSPLSQLTKFTEDTEAHYLHILRRIESRKMNIQTDRQIDRTGHLCQHPLFSTANKVTYCYPTHNNGVEETAHSSKVLRLPYVELTD